MTDEYQTKWDGFVEMDQSDPNTAVNYISEHLISAVDKANIKFFKRSLRHIS